MHQIVIGEEKYPVIQIQRTTLPNDDERNFKETTQDLLYALNCGTLNNQWIVHINTSTTVEILTKKDYILIAPNFKIVQYAIDQLNWITNEKFCGTLSNGKNSYHKIQWERFTQGNSINLESVKASISNDLLDEVLHVPEISEGSLNLPNDFIENIKPLFKFYKELSTTLEILNNFSYFKVPNSDITTKNKYTYLEQHIIELWHLWKILQEENITIPQNALSKFSQIFQPDGIKAAPSYANLIDPILAMDDRGGLTGEHTFITTSKLQNPFENANQKKNYLRLRSKYIYLKEINEIN